MSDRFELISQIAPIGICHTDSKGHLCFHNAMWSFHCGDEPKPGSYWFEALCGIDKAQVATRWHHDRKRFNCCSYELVCDTDGEHRRLLCQLIAEKNAASEITGYVGTLSDITAQKDHHSEIEKLSHYDSLTALPNRQLLRNRIEQQLRTLTHRKGRFALLSLDIDHFKRINDSLGRETGDQVIAILARRLGGCIAEEDIVARPGGDEFLLSITHADHIDNLASLASRLLQSISMPILVNSHSIVVTASLGIALAPDDATDAEQLMKSSELAMYNAKERGRNNFQFFSPAMNNQAAERLLLENDLRTAIEQKQLYVCYQPKFNITNGEIFGVEALVRWRHPLRGEIRPDQFIGIAEHIGQINSLGKLVLEQACRDIKELRDTQQVNADFHISINLSAKQFQSFSLLHAIVMQLMQHQLPGHCLDLEITESVIMENFEQASAMLHVLKNRGVTISIDDFGTGYSSLGYLKKLPVDTVKIDRSFVRDLPDNQEDANIVDAIIAMSHKLGLRVVAEGIETVEQLEALRYMGCDHGQGYLIAKPLKLADLVQLLPQYKNDTARLGYFSTGDLLHTTSPSSLQ